MNRIFSILTIIIATLGTCFAQVDYHRIDSLVQSYVDSNNSIGISIALIDSSTIKYFNSGHIDKSKAVRITENTIFEIGSCTKTFNGLLLTNAVLEGKIRLDDKIDKYLSPEVTFKPFLKNRITIEQLLTHSSGLPTYHNSNDYDQDEGYDSLNTFHHLTPRFAFNLLNGLTDFDPDEFVYSNFATGLLGLIMERVYNKSWEELLQQKICSKYNFTNTSTKVFNGKTYSLGYDKEGNSVDFIDVGFMTGAGLMKSNAIDMANFIRNQMLSEETEILRSQTIIKDYDGLKMSYGWFVQEANGARIFLHPGGTEGQSSMISFDSINQKGLVFLTNSNNSDKLKILFSEILKVFH